jgi:hypothetical protein
MRLLAKADSMRDFDPGRSITKVLYHEIPACKAGFSWQIKIGHRDPPCKVDYYVGASPREPSYKKEISD